MLNFVDPFIQYNERGEILDRDRQVIQGSHIDDLLQHAVRDMRRKNVKPSGWDYFKEVLTRENVPHNIIGAPTITEMSKPKKQFAPTVKLRKSRIKEETDEEPVIPRRSRYDKFYSKH